MNIFFIAFLIEWVSKGGKISTNYGDLIMLQCPTCFYSWSIQGNPPDHEIRRTINDMHSHVSHLSITPIPPYGESNIP